MKNKLMSKSFLWMFIGLLTTFATGYFVAHNESMLISIFSGYAYFIFAIVEIALVIFLSARVHKMKTTTARICFLLYSFISGLTFSSIFVVYEITSILYVFLIAALVFLVFGLIGYFTNIDLTKFGSFLLMALFAVIICLIVNIFIGSEKFDLALTIVSLLIFLGFTAYDVQRIKRAADYDLPEDNLSIICALNLYLDYINIFMDLLNLIGNSKD